MLIATVFNTILSSFREQRMNSAQRIWSAFFANRYLGQEMLEIPLHRDERKTSEHCNQLQLSKSTVDYVVYSTLNWLHQTNRTNKTHERCHNKHLQEQIDDDGAVKMPGSARRQMNNALTMWNISSNIDRLMLFNAQILNVLKFHFKYLARCSMRKAPRRDSKFV